MPLTAAEQTRESIADFITAHRPLAKLEFKRAAPNAANSPPKIRDGKQRIDLLNSFYAGIF
jgi:hypothetical protein